MILITIISGFALLTLNACGTIEGIGNDLQGAGQVISTEAKKAKKS